MQTPKVIVVTLYLPSHFPPNVLLATGRRHGGKIYSKAPPCRRDYIYDFLHASFVVYLRGEYQQFCCVKDIDNFSFSNIFANLGFQNIKWDNKVQVLYFPFQADRWHWIGVFVDIANWCIHVLDCNSTCPNEKKLEALMNLIVVLLPLLIRLNGGKASIEAEMDSPMPIKRLDLPLLCEQRGMSDPYYFLLYRIVCPEPLVSRADVWVNFFCRILVYCIDTACQPELVSSCTSKRRFSCNCSTYLCNQSLWDIKPRASP